MEYVFTNVLIFLVQVDGSFAFYLKICKNLWKDIATDLLYSSISENTMQFCIEFI